MPQINQCTNENIRNWPRINEAYVTQGVPLLQHYWVDGWDDELEMMNDRKSGRPYKFPESLIQFAETLKTVLRLPFRRLEGFLQALACFLGSKCPTTPRLAPGVPKPGPSAEGGSVRIRLDPGRRLHRDQGQRSGRVDEGKVACAPRLDKGAHVHRGQVRIDRWSVGQRREGQ
jgi:hypothetical protein